MASISSSIQKLDSVTFDDLVAENDPFGEKGDSTFDLNGIKLITPVALVSLAAVCFGLALIDQYPVILIDDPLVRTYLLRSGFVQLLEPIAAFVPCFSAFEFSGYHLFRGSNELLIEVTKVETGKSLSELLDRIVSVFRHRLKYRKRDAFDVATAISEIGQNAFDHNKGVGGLIGMQVYGRGANRFLEIGVADYGDGLANTLQRNPKYFSLRSDSEAIAIATALGTSEHIDQTRGTGLYHLLEIAYKNMGLVQIRSGKAKRRYRMDKRKGWGFKVSQVPGVQIGLTLPSK